MRHPVQPPRRKLNPAPGGIIFLKYSRPPRLIATVPFIIGYHAVFADMSARRSARQCTLAQTGDAGAAKKVLPPPAAVEYLHCVRMGEGADYRRIEEAVPSGVDRGQGFVAGRTP